MNDLAPTEFSLLLKEAFARPQAEIDAFFEHHFLKPLNTQLDSDENIPAKKIRHQRQQTNKIKTYLIQLTKK